MENKHNFCDNCKRNIEHNFTLHIIQCEKLNKLCPMCQEPIRKDEMKEHIETMHVIELCRFCKKPFERWKLEEHENNCSRKPVLCKFCNLDVAADDFKEHAEMCWSRTEKCSTCAQYVKLRDMEFHERTCKNPSMMGFADCKFCKEHFPFHVIETHESVCGEKNTRCPDCGDRIKKYKNNHTCIAKKNSSTSSVSARSEKANGHDRNREVSSRPPFNDNHHSPNSFPIEPAKKQAVELTPPVQRDLSDQKLNRLFQDRNTNIPTQCTLCLEYLIPQESRIHPEICPRRLTLCKFCQNQVPYNILHPELHQCRIIYHKSGSSAMDEPGRQDNSPGYGYLSNLSKEAYKVQTQDCPLCFKTFPVDRFDEHVRACAKGKKLCHICKNEFFGETKEHFEKCPGRQPKKGKKKNEEKNEGLIARGLNLFNLGHRKENKYVSAGHPAEKQLVVDGIPCEFCNEIYPFAEIAVHELGCMHEMSQAEEQMKKSAEMKKFKEEVPQASGFTPYNPRDYMITDPYENKDREPRNNRFAEKSSKDASSKFSYSQPNRGSGNSHNHQNAFYEKHLVKETPCAEKSTKDTSSKFSSYSGPNQGSGNSRNHQNDAFSDNFYEKHLVKDHERDISAARSLKEPRKAIEEGKKKDIIFKYSSETKNKFPAPVQEKRVETLQEQGARPKYQAGEHLREKYSIHKGLNCLSDSDEETDSHQNKVKDVNLENNRGFSSAVYTGDHKLNAIGSEREQKMSSIESKNNNLCISNENATITNSSSQDVSSCVANKKGSFNSDTSEDVYLSCDEGEDIPEARSFNKDAKVENCSTDERISNQEDKSQKYISMSDFEKYLKRDKDANVLKNEEKDERNGNTEKRSLSGKKDIIPRHDISMNDFDKYLKRDKLFNVLKNEDKHDISMSDFENYLKRDNDSNILKNEEKDGRNCNTENRSLFGKEDILPRHDISMNDFDEYLKGDQNDNRHLKAIDTITSKSSILWSHKEKHSLLHGGVVMGVDDLESEADKKNEETFASDSQVEMNPFEAMSNNSQFSYETVSSLPPYSTADLDNTNHGAVDMKSDDNLDAYLQFLGLNDPEPDANYRLFKSTHGSKALEPDSSYGCLENVQYNTNTHVPKMTSVPQEPSVQTEELKGVSKNMSSYTSPFLLGNEVEEGESGISPQRSFQTQLHEEKIREMSDKSRIIEKDKSREEKDNELNSKIWGTWRSPPQIDSD